MEIIKMDGQIQMTKRLWWQIYKKGWHKHNDLWGGLWWIRFKWSQEEHKQDRTCNNNCSVVCGECQIFKPKQETIEEAAERLYPNGCDGTDRSAEIYRRIFIEGAKWQQERMYNEMNDYANYRLLIKKPLPPKEWFEKFKKK